MLAFLAWYLASSLIGWLAVPLVVRLLPALPDRGYTLARAAGLLAWGWTFWLLASLGLLRNDLGGLLVALLILIVLSLLAVSSSAASSGVDWALLVRWATSHRTLIGTAELLFLAAFAFMAFVRACSPEAVGTEKPMELAFLNAILRSPTLPAHDPWMSGYSISYYHFGYIMAAMLARLTGVSGALAFNLMLALVFALAAVASYGILYNLLVAWRAAEFRSKSSPSSDVALSRYALLAPLFLLLLANLEGVFEVMHSLGWFWPADPSAFNFWTWLNVKDLNLPPSGQGGLPTRYLWWWRASRVIADFDLNGNHQEVIDEFPAFSFVLGDLHPHVLALPFNLLGIGLALNLFLGGWSGSLRVFDLPLRASWRDLLTTAIVLGGLAFLNTWDILPITALILGAYLLRRLAEPDGRWEEALLLGVLVVIASFLLYLPFYVGFSSQAGGLLPNLIHPTRGAHFWMMWGTLLPPLFAFLIYLTRLPELSLPYRTALLLTLGLILVLWAFSWLLALLIWLGLPEAATQFLQHQGQPDFRSLFQAATLRRFSYLGGLFTIAALLWLIGSLLLARRPADAASAVPDSHLSASSDHPDPRPFFLSPFAFPLLLSLIAALLVLAPEFIYLRDAFLTRMNTVFKFYYQAWQLWAIAAAFGSVILLNHLSGKWRTIWQLALSLILAAGLVYPVLAFLDRTNRFRPPNGYTLDASAHLTRYHAEDAAVVQYLQSAPLGVVAEAVGGSYSNYARIATYTGLPTVLGWPWHEFQWRGDWVAHGMREADVKTLYETPFWETAKEILQRYQIRYIVVGGLERAAYRVREEKFQSHLQILFRMGNTVIYGVP